MLTFILTGCQTSVEDIYEQAVVETTEEKVEESQGDDHDPEMQKEPVVEPSHWIDDATIYEVNLRQYTPEGTLAAFEDELPRLQTLGVEILWFMPIHPISLEKRKGSLGSYYAVADYKGFNP